MENLQKRFKEFIDTRPKGTPYQFAEQFLEFLNQHKVPCYKCGNFHGYKGGYRMGYYMCLNPHKSHRLFKQDMMYFLLDPKQFLALDLHASRV